MTATAHLRLPTWGDLFALSLIFGSFLLFWALMFGGGYVHALLDQRAYHAAPFCSQGAATQPCRLPSYATVTDGRITHGKSSSSYWVDVTLPTRATYEGSVNRVVWYSLSMGQPVQVEIWNGKLSALNGLETLSSPDSEVDQGRSLVLVMAVPLGVIVPLAALFYVRWRRRPGTLAVAA